MAVAYNTIDADGHVLEPFSLWEDYMDPALRERRPRVIIDENGKERMPSKASSSATRAASAALARLASGKARQARQPQIRRREEGRVRPARAHRRHGSRRHRRRLSLPQPWSVRRGSGGSPARGRDMPRLQPLARRLLQALPRPPVRRGDAADAVGRARDRGDALAREQLGFAVGSCGRTHTTARR